MPNDEILTVKETAALLKTTRQQVRKMIVNEELPAVKVGREWRVLKAGIMEFFEENLWKSLSYHTSIYFPHQHIQIKFFFRAVEHDLILWKMKNLADIFSLMFQIGKLSCR